MSQLYTYMEDIHIPTNPMYHDCTKHIKADCYLVRICNQGSYHVRWEIRWSIGRVFLLEGISNQPRLICGMLGIIGTDVLWNKMLIVMAKEVNWCHQKSDDQLADLSTKGIARSWI